MAEKGKYMIKVEGRLVEVTPEVYYAYFRMERQERGQEEKKTYNNVMSYDALDDEEKKAIDNIPDTDSTSLEEIVIANDMKNRLHKALDMLPKGERELLQAIYFQGKSEEKYGNEVGISQKGISYQCRKALSNLRTIYKALGGILSNFVINIREKACRIQGFYIILLEVFPILF